MHICVRRFAIMPNPTSLHSGEMLSFAFSEASSYFLFQKELVLQAVQKDQEGERSAALSLYCAALEHFVPAIHCKSNNLSHILSVA